MNASGRRVADAGGEARIDAGVEDEDAEVRVVLGGEAVQDLVEPGPGIVGDDDRDDGRCGAAGAVHEPSRVVVGPPAGTVMVMAEAASDDLFSQVSAVASDALYVAVGFGVLGFQRLQVRRRELEAQLPPEVTGVLRAAGERLGAAVGRRASAREVARHVDHEVGGGPREEADRARAGRHRRTVARLATT